MNFFERIGYILNKRQPKDVKLSRTTTESFFDTIEALDTIKCPECKSNIIDEPYDVTRCNICFWSENGVGTPCTTPECEGDMEYISLTMSFCFDCNTPTYQMEQ